MSYRKLWRMYAIQTIPESKKPPNGFQCVNCHMVLDIKMVDFHRKAHLLAGGYMTHTLDTMIYFSVVTRETVHIALTMSALHNLEFKAADVLNAYVMAPIQENIWTVLGPEFGDDGGKSAIIVRAIYGLKSADASFREHHAQYMQKLGYQSCDADLDLWMKAEYRPEDKLEDYSYILCYVEYILCIDHDPDTALKKLNRYVSLKHVSVGSTDMYFGTKTKHMQLHNGIWAWSMSPSEYVQEAVRICKEHIAKHMTKHYKLPKRTGNPSQSGYCPELDVSLVLESDEISYYKFFIGVMRWMIEIG